MNLCDRLKTLEERVKKLEEALWGYSRDEASEDEEDIQDLGPDSYFVVMSMSDDPATKYYQGVNKKTGTVMWSTSLSVAKRFYSETSAKLLASGLKPPNSNYNKPQVLGCSEE